MSYLPNRDYLLEVARGKITGQALVRRAGINADIDTGGEEDVWAAGGSITWQTSAQSLEAISSDVDDVASTGTGARTIKVWGLNGSYASVNETVNMNGTTAVSISTSMVFVDRVEILTTGSSETNEGDITVRLASAGATMAFMPAGFGQAFQSSYFVPASKTAYLISWSSSLYKAVSGSAEMRLMISEDGVGWRVVGLHELTQTGSSQATKTEGDLLVALPAKTRVRVRAKTSADNTGVSSELVMVLIDN